MECPECGKDLGDGSDLDFTFKVWLCSECDIRITKTKV